jgi:hypothetical protein
MVDSYEYGNEPSGSIKYSENFHILNNGGLPHKQHVPRSEIVGQKSDRVAQSV